MFWVKAHRSASLDVTSSDLEGEERGGGRRRKRRERRGIFLSLNAFVGPREA